MPRPEARAATTADYPTFARLFPELESGDPLPSAERFELEIAPRTIMLEVERVPVAYGFWRDAGAGMAHVIHVVVDPARRREGLGRALMSRFAELFRAAGFDRWCLNVKLGNDAAISLYESCGLRAEQQWTSLSMPRAALARVPPPALVVEAPAARRDDLIERTFGLRAGQVAVERGRPNRVVLEARDGDESTGFVSFDPTFPGANPFRARTVEAAAALAHCLLPHALAHHEAILVMTLEPVAEQALIRAGAEVRYRGLRMEGPLG